jgi:hypothetical protein
MELLKALLDSQPGGGSNLVHAAFEAARGANTIVACAEAECEAVRISVIGVLATVIALRRRMDPSLYGSEMAGGGAAVVASNALSSASVLQAKERQLRLLQVRELGGLSVGRYSSDYWRGSRLHLQPRRSFL